MELRLGDKAPDFKQESTEGRIHFYEWAGRSWVVLFSHPGDFTPVCTTELGRAAKLAKEFARRDVKVLGLSVDPVSSHRAWITDIFETQGEEVNFPILADKERAVADLYGMIHPNVLANSTVRSVFIIDPEKSIRAMMTYPASTGRNFAEILRVIDSLQMTDKYKVATPVDWTPGDNVVILPTIQDEAEIAKLFPRGHRTLTPYLRTTPDPSGNRKYEQAWSQYR